LTRYGRQDSFFDPHPVVAGTSPGKTVMEMGDLNLTSGLAEAGQPWDKHGHDEPEAGAAPK
jgi:hypothetical protein